MLRWERAKQRNNDETGGIVSELKNSISKRVMTRKEELIQSLRNMLR
jgi:hypothetical protein